MIMYNTPHNLKTIYGSGYRQSISSTTRLTTVNPKADYVFIQVLGGDVYFTTDGRTPTSSNGKLLSDKQFILLHKDDASRARLVSPSGSAIDVDFLTANV